MQTFLPYSSYINSASVLDRKRLGKQRVEAYQILRALILKKGWINHPATKMWRRYERSLAQYGAAMCEEWISRGYHDSLLPYFRLWIQSLPDTGNPPWLGNYAFHLSHRSNLIRKLPDHYLKFFPDTPHDLPYVWPDQNGE